MTRHSHRWLPAAVALIAAFPVPAEAQMTQLRYPEIRVATAKRGSARYSCLFGVNRARDRSEVQCSGRGGRVLRRADLVRISDGTTLATAAVSGRSFTIPIPNPTAAAVDALLEGGLRIRLFSSAALVAQGTFKTPAGGLVWTLYRLSLAGTPTVGPIQTANGNVPSGEVILVTEPGGISLADGFFKNFDLSTLRITDGNSTVVDLKDYIDDRKVFGLKKLSRNQVKKIRGDGTSADSLGSGKQLVALFPELCHPAYKPAVRNGRNTMCLNDNRFEVEIDWRDFTGLTGAGHPMPKTDHSGLFYFYPSTNNWEVLVNVLDRCSNNSHYWVYAGGATNVEYTLRVTDTTTGQTRSYGNPLGTQAEAITDTSAFATCPQGKPSRPRCHDGLAPRAARDERPAGGAGRSRPRE